MIWLGCTFKKPHQSNTYFMQSAALDWVCGAKCWTLLSSFVNRAGRKCCKPNSALKRPYTALDPRPCLHTLWPVCFVLLVHGIYRKQTATDGFLEIKCWLSPRLTIYLRFVPDSRRRWINTVGSIRGVTYACLGLRTQPLQSSWPQCWIHQQADGFH